MICSSCDADVVTSKLFRDKGIKREYAIATASVSIKPVRTTISQQTLIIKSGFVGRKILCVPRWKQSLLKKVRSIYAKCFNKRSVAKTVGMAKLAPESKEKAQTR
jgi:hypothetical protein